MKFKDLSVGDKFRFSHELPGLAHGPWKKLSQRIYAHETDKQLSRVRIGSINVEVQKLPHRPLGDLLHDYARMWAETAIREYLFSLSPPLYLCGKRSKASLAHDELQLARRGATPYDFHVLIDKHVPRNAPVDVLTSWFLTEFRTLPIIPAIEQYYA